MKKQVDGITRSPIKIKDPNHPVKQGMKKYGWGNEDKDYYSQPFAQPKGHREITVLTWGLLTIITLAILIAIFK